MWVFCITERLKISAAHIPGVSSKKSNKHSKILDDSQDRQLNPKIFKKYYELSVKYKIDLFIYVLINN